MKQILVLLLTFYSISVVAQNKDITLEDIWQDYVFYPSSIQGLNSMNDGIHFSKITKENELQFLNKYSFETGEIIDSITSSEDLGFNIGNYSFSENEEKIVFATETESIYRYSSRSIFYILNLKTKKVSKVSDDKIMYATLSPNGKKIAYVKENNLFIKNLVNNKITQVTKDGESNEILNGVSDWVYEEEFGLVESFFWSPQSDKIAYYKFDESKVAQFSMDFFKQELYPTQYEFKYPKAGEDNSKVSIHVYSLKNGTNKKISFEKDHEYIPRLGWTNNENILYAITLNRLQNELDFHLVNSKTNKTRVLFSESDKYYIDIHDNTTFLDDNKNFVWTSEKSGFNHLYLISLEDGNSTQITKGNFEVSSYHGLNKESNRLFFSSTEDGAINRSIYSIASDGTNKQKLSSGLGVHNPTFSKGMKFYINNFSDANSAPYISLNDNSGKIIRVLEDNEKLNTTMSEYQISNKEFFSFETSEKVNLNGWMIKPNDFDENKKHPVFMFLYGGPGSQQVMNSFGWFNYFWYQHLAQQGYIVVCVDNRGTGGRGSEFKKMTYKELGKYETIDQIEANKYLRNLSYVDSSRIGIQGWSYGGYMSSLAITKGADYFKMAIAVAPVTNWRYYDNIYTERYMGTPQDNASGYDDNSPINHVEKLKGKYLLIHGTGDDNVHVQNTYEMTSALVKANKQFDLFVYPDKNHGIYGGNTRLHLYRMMTDYILNNL
jgi:dipeptidyl-peptidase 4